MTQQERQQARRISLIVTTVSDSIRKMYKTVDVLVGKRDGRYCIKVADIRSDKMFNNIKDMLDERYCESLMFVESTKTTLMYALPPLHITKEV